MKTSLSLEEIPSLREEKRRNIKSSSPRKIVGVEKVDQERLDKDQGTRAQNLTAISDVLSKEKLLAGFE